MNRTELVSKVSEITGISKVQASELTKTVFEVIRDGILQDEVVQIADFGVFKIRDRAARSGRNPKTGEALAIPARSTIKFTPSKDFKEAIQPAE